VDIQHEIDNNDVFSEDCKGSVWKSWEGGRWCRQCLGWVIWESMLVHHQHQRQKLVFVYAE